MRPITKVVSVSLILSAVLGIAIYVARVILDGQLTDAWTSLLAAAHVLVYVLFLIAGTIVVRMKTACSQRRLHRKVSNGSLHQTNTRESCSLDSPGDSFNRSRIFYPSDFAIDGFNVG